MADGFLLPGEHQLAEEFAVSRGTLREALAELKRRNYIATQSGVGSIAVVRALVNAENPEAAAAALMALLG